MDPRAVFVVALKMFFEDNASVTFLEDDEDDLGLIILALLASKERNNRNSIKNYFEVTIPNYSDEEFFKFFRMTRRTYSLLLLECKQHVVDQQASSKYPLIPFEKQLLITLWYLAKGATLIDISDKFDVTVSSVWRCLDRILDILVTLKSKYIKWPSENECTTISAQFMELGPLPNVIGTMDGTTIKCKVPARHADSYLDRNFNFSVKLQGVCTATKLFTNICVGWPGNLMFPLSVK